MVFYWSSKNKYGEEFGTHVDVVLDKDLMEDEAEQTAISTVYSDSDKLVMY